MSDLNVLIGNQRFLRICDETSWGVLPGTPTWYDAPVSDYTVMFKPDTTSNASTMTWTNV